MQVLVDGIEADAHRSTIEAALLPSPGVWGPAPVEPSRRSDKGEETDVSRLGASSRRIIASLAATCVLAAVSVGVGSSPAAALPTFVAHGSVNQVYVTKLVAGRRRRAARLVRLGGRHRHRRRAGRLPLPQRRRRDRATSCRQDGAELGAARRSCPRRQPARQPSYQGIPLHAGFNYIPTRDGTLLSANITFPNDGSSGPWPVLLDYSGYDPSQPGGAPSEAAMFPLPGLRRRRRSTCAAPGARAAPSTTSRSSRTSTATTRSRRWPTRRGRTATSAWSASPTWASASCSWPRPDRRTCGPSRRCRSSPTRCARRWRRAASSTPASPCRGPRTATSPRNPRPTSGSRTRSRPRRPTASRRARTTSSCACSR